MTIRPVYAATYEYEAMQAERDAAQAEAREWQDTATDYQLERDEETLRACRAEDELARIKGKVASLVAYCQEAYDHSSDLPLIDIIEQIRAILDPEAP